MKITNMRSVRSGRIVPNQFVIYDNNEIKFQSYNSIIAVKKINQKTLLDSIYWNWSKTTSKYRSIFLNENTQTTRDKILSGEYILTDLNYVEYK